MGLFAAVRNAPLLRPNAIPSSKNMGIVCLRKSFASIPDVLLGGARGIFIVDVGDEECCSLEDEISKRMDRIVPVRNIKNISYIYEMDIVFFHHEYEYGPMFTFSWKYLRNVGHDVFYTFMPIPYNHGITTSHIPGYYESNKENLDTVFTLLSDEESKAIFAARIRAIGSGNVGFVRVSDYEEYFHPQVRPEFGDIIMDGGVSGHVISQIAFIKAVGPEGRIYGFEPDPVGFCAAREHLKGHDENGVDKVVPLGLWNKRETVHFEIAGQGTRAASSKSERTVACDVVDVDEFVRTGHLRDVNFIKLDVEGSEVNALKGAIRTILEFRPKLAISVYHRPQDLYFIPLLIKSMCSEYEFFLGHHHASLHETILYCKPV